jgi:hypothetical protein
MEISILLLNGLSLRISDGLDPDNHYPSSKLQKAFRLIKSGRSLVQEAVGFGFPLVKTGLTAIFPGKAELSYRERGADREVTGLYTLNLRERIARPRSAGVRYETFDEIKNVMAYLIRRVPPVRGALTGVSSLLRDVFDLTTSYDDAGCRLEVKVVYSVSPRTGTMHVEVDWPDLIKSGVTEAAIMNEQGALYFDNYKDSLGSDLYGNEIDCWKEVRAEEASFIDMLDRVGFSLRSMSDGRLFRGRECIGSRLAWAGFGYSVKPHLRHFGYDLRIWDSP